MTTIPDFIDINSKEDIEKLIELYEQETDSKVHLAQDTKVLINIMAYYGALIKSQFNDAAKLNFVQTSRYPVLDFLGAYKDCVRNEDEDDDSYRERILLSDEKYSVAGPRAAYIYHAKSADSTIVDVGVEVPDDTASLKINEIEKTDFTIDYKTGVLSYTFDEALSADDKIEVKIPRPYLVYLYILTETGEASEDVIQKVEEKLNDDIRPLCDYPVVKSAVIQNFEIKGTVTLTKEANETEVQTNVNSTLKSYLDGLKTALNKTVVLNKIISLILSVDGVFDFKLISPESELTAKNNTCYTGTIGEIIYQRGQND